MALSRTSLLSTSASPAHGTGSFTTGSFTPANNSLLVVVVAVNEQSGLTDPSGDITITDSETLTWTTQQTVGNANSWSIGVRVFTAPVSTGASMTVTVDCGSRNIYNYKVQALCYTGYDTGSPIGATASSSSTAVNGAESLTLSASPATGSEVLAWLQGNVVDFTNGSAVTHGTGWTELYDHITTYGGITLQTQVRTGSTSTTVGWDDVSENGDLWKGVAGAIEIKAASSSGFKASFAAAYLNAILN